MMAILLLGVVMLRHVQGLVVVLPLHTYVVCSDQRDNRSMVTMVPPRRYQLLKLVLARSPMARFG